MIMNEIEDKHPRDAFGYTLFHAAASGGQLETFKMIMNKADTDINPSENGGWTVSSGHRFMRLLRKAIC